MHTGRRRLVIAVSGAAILLFGVIPEAFLWQARERRLHFEGQAHSRGRPIDSELPAVLARVAAISPPFAGRAGREAAIFWLSLAGSTRPSERRLGATRRLSNRIARSYSEALRADPQYSAAPALPALMERSRFDVAARRRGSKIERRHRSLLRLARWFSGAEPQTCRAAQPAELLRFDPSGWGGSAELTSAVAQAVKGRDDAALERLDLGLREDASNWPLQYGRGLILLRRGDHGEAARAFLPVVRERAASPVHLAAMIGRALALLGMDRPDDALFAIEPQAGQGELALIRLVASFVSGDVSGARVALRRVRDTSPHVGLRDALSPALVHWSRGRRKHGRALISEIVAHRSSGWDYLLSLARFAAGRAEDVEAWIERAGPRDPLDRVWQLFALERAARERGSSVRAMQFRALRRAICR